MNILWQLQNPPVTQNELDRFEELRGIKIPKSYRDFISANRGGYSAGGDDTLFAPTWNETPVSVWYGTIGSSYGGTFFKRDLGNFSPTVAEKFLQFAEDPGGQIFVIDLRPRSYGRVYVRDHDGPINSPPVIDDEGFSNDTDYEEAELFHPISESFDAFLNLLGPDSDLQ
jgi:cell wall assembly regulator SMI1